MKVSLIVVLFAVLCLAAFITDIAHASHGNERQAKQPHGNEHQAKQPHGNEHQAKQPHGNEHQEKQPHGDEHRPAVVAPVFVPTSVVRVSYSTECPAQRHHSKDKAPVACKEEKYTFDKEQGLVANKTNGVTKFALLSNSEFERLVAAVSFYKNVAAPSPSRKSQPVAPPKHSVKLYWFKNSNEVPAKKDELLRDLTKETNSAQYFYTTAKANNYEKNLDKLIKELTAGKKWTELPTKASKIESIKLVGVIAASGLEVQTAEKHIFTYEGKVSHKLYLDEPQQADRHARSEPVSEKGKVESLEHARKPFKNVIHDNIIFVDSVFGKPQEGASAKVIHIEWRSESSHHKVLSKNFTVWDTSSAPAEVVELQNLLVSLVGEITFDQPQPQPHHHSSSSSHASCWKTVSYILYGLFATTLLCVFLKRVFRKRTDYSLLEEEKKVSDVFADEEPMLEKSSAQPIV